ncbi:MAG TPA: ABC transporter ATP-binding protein [Acidimicrobiales bacterium]|nr:ABC transporter ATP-binding protein [Acidimicrobiales bacterium]
MLELRDVTAGYGSHVVLRNVSLVVPDESVVSLLGPNGAGKTTLLRVASGLLRPMSGSVILNGQDITGWPPHRRARAGIGHVPEGRGIFAAMTVDENLRMQTKPNEKGGVDAAVDAFPRLAQRRRQLAGSLSGGEQQMLALASMYLGRPEVVLLDEVSMGLAPKIVDELYVHLRKAAASGAALLLVEQYVSRALNLAQYVYVLKKGEVDFVGQPCELGESEVLAAYLGVSA